MNYLSSRNILHENQHKFRGKKSTTTALIVIIEFIVETLDAREEIMLTCLGLSKQVIEKLGYYGIRGPMLDLLKSYLKNRYQVVEWQNEKSTKRKLNRGVLQGSILGLTLFILYINDLMENVKSDSEKIFTDDFTLLNKSQYREQFYEKFKRLKERERKNWRKLKNCMLQTTSRLIEARLKY